MAQKGLMPPSEYAPLYAPSKIAQLEMDVRILQYVQEVLLYKMGQDFLDIQYTFSKNLLQGQDLASRVLAGQRTRMGHQLVKTFPKKNGYFRFTQNKKIFELFEWERWS